MVVDLLLLYQHQRYGGLADSFVRQTADRKQLIVVLRDEVCVDVPCLKLWVSR